MKSRSLSLTGATGFVGWHLAEAFLRDGWDVRAVVRRGNRKAVPPGVTTVEADLTATALAEAAAGSDLFIHGAAIVRAADEATFTAVNVEGTRAAAQAARRIDARFLHISSQAAGGVGTVASPRRELDPPGPVNAYGRSKLAAEGVVRSVERLRWTIVRPCAVYGPRDRAFLPLFKLARRGIFVVPSGAEAAFTLIYIHDLVRAIGAAATADRAIGETLFLGHPDPGSSVDVLRAIASAEGRAYRPLRIPAPVFGAMARLGDLAWKLGVEPPIDSARLIELRADGFVCAVERAHEVLGFSASTTLLDGLAQTGRWYRDTGWL
jgi:nucleoside-diphosphate-sugar epimerase